LAGVKAPALVVMGDQDPDFASPLDEANWIGGVLHAEVVMVPEAGHYPQSQRPDVMTAAVLRFLNGLSSDG
jgi:pimeloyl-ACP methyl ester carboxylesterase